MNLIMVTIGGVLVGLAIATLAEGIAVALGVAIGGAKLLGGVIWVVLSILGLVAGLVIQFGGK